MQTILVPTDFSNCSADAIKYAILFAEKSGQNLVFFNSTFLLIPTGSSAKTYLNAIKLEKKTKLKTLTDFTEKIYNSLKIKRNVKNTKFIVKFGNSVVENITETINEQFIDLIIIGTHGATGFRKFFLGSNTASIIEKSVCAVLAIPKNYKFDGINTIAYASSDLTILKKQLKKIIPIVQKLEASLEIFHITFDEDPNFKWTDFNSTEFMKTLSRQLKFYNMSLYVIKGEKNTVIESIRDFVKHKKPNMLTMRTNKRSFFEKIIRPSQTKEMSYQLNVPLMALK